MKKYICIAVLCALCLYCAGAQEEYDFNIADLTVPSPSPFMSSYFNKVLASALPARFDYFDVNFTSRSFRAQYDGQEDTRSFVFNAAGAIKLWLVKPDSNARFKVVIPLYGGITSAMGDTVKNFIEQSGMFAGSGLHIITDYVLLYGYAAYGQDSYYDRNSYDAAYKNWEESGHGYQPAKSDYQYETHNVLWSVMSVINMGKIPLLGSVFSLFDGYLTLESNPDEFTPSYQARVLFRDIPAGKGRVGFATVTASDWYDSIDAKYTEYGGRVGIQLGELSVITEGGYRMFFDVAPDNRSFFQDGPYGRLFLGWLPEYDNRKMYRKIGLYALAEISRQNWPLPKFGLIGTHSVPGKYKVKVYSDYYLDDRSSGLKVALNSSDFLRYEFISSKKK
jgi:hypothetical protein